MTDKVLFVDDDQKVLNGVCRQFDDELNFETALGPEEALERLETDGPFAVVVSDMRMPGMNGVELLSIVRQRSPMTIRMMLTGFADLESTIQAVNEGNVFRFLSKPCSHNVLKNAVQDGLNQFRLVNAEAELLEGTLHGSIKVLSEMLSLINPLAFGRTSRVQRIALAIGSELKFPQQWDLKIASLLFPLGCITVSEETLECVLQGKPIPEAEIPAYSKHAEIAQNMLGSIPRLETVAEIVALQDKGYDGSGSPQSKSIRGDAIPLGARILKVASDFEIATRANRDPAVALERLRAKSFLYDPKVLNALEKALQGGLCQATTREVPVVALASGMILGADIRGATGQLLVSKGQTVSQSIEHRLQSLCENGIISDVVEVEVPDDATEPTAVLA